MLKTLCTLLATCCAVAAASAADPLSADHGDSMVYAKYSHPYGRTINGWANLSMQWIYQEPYSQNPYFDPTGEYCGVGQSGPVWYVAPIFAPTPGSYTRSCTIPHDKSILFQVGWVADTWPCPDPTFGPAPGQSLYDFLYTNSETYFSNVTVSVTLDGKPIHDAVDYHYISDSLNAIKGDLSLQANFDPCITGNYQEIVTNGWFLMFKPLSPGVHTIVSTTTNMGMMMNTFTYYLTIE
ncbi:hypothetical protein [Dyella psychrodurans]|uniref:Uncharacterized protein n=1 Tax=Dyella psychrodurans TaxID=1927960 RepID=A0A370WW68_9GAMM|nr:hypothetical protein [Dyella psychrodurans]RDS80374.1 hypothetical protein DWU99_19835 [Dyella psychrodurans]